MFKLRFLINLLIIIIFQQVKLYHVIETKTKLYLILELGDGGDMFDYIMRHDRGLKECQAKEYFSQVCFKV